MIEFCDFNGHIHRFIEKWPVVSAQEFDNSFPKDCTIACMVVKEKETSYIVDTSNPWNIASEEGKTVFEIHNNLLVTHN